MNVKLSAAKGTLRLRGSGSMQGLAMQTACVLGHQSSRCDSMARDCSWCIVRTEHHHYVHRVFGVNKVCTPESGSQHGVYCGLYLGLSAT